MEGKTIRKQEIDGTEHNLYPKNYMSVFIPNVNGKKEKKYSIRVYGHNWDYSDDCKDWIGKRIISAHEFDAGDDCQFFTLEVVEKERE